MKFTKKRKVFLILGFFVLFSKSCGNPFEDESDEVSGKSHPYLGQSKNRGFHAKVDPDEDNNGFSYRVEATAPPEKLLDEKSNPYVKKDSFSKAKSEEKSIITGIPDLSDPCFRRYANSIIVNAQPYERRSSISLISCKTQCLQSQIGVYSCRSFVYDNVNQVCDLFAHVGDQSPARLLRFQTRDYFEPTSAISCNSEALTGAVTTSTTTTSTLENFPETTLLKEQDNLSEAFTLSNVVVSPPAPQPSPQPTLPPSVVSTCESGKTARFLKTKDFELHSFDDATIEGISLEECINFCSSDLAGNGSTLKCNSFEYGENKCVLSTETAVPLGNGQLKQQQGTDYFEKVCVDEKLARECPTIYNRFPQMILVGFAETVVDANSLQQCFDNCLNSKKLYGFKCISGMYYFEEPQLNCILNTEDRFTQPDLFTSESSDLVDYFETGCNSSMTGAVRRFASPSVSSDNFSNKKQDSVIEQEDSQSEWTEWSSCLGATSIQQRTKICKENKICGHDSRPCEKQEINSEIRRSPIKKKLPNQLTKEQVLEALKRSKCPLDTCCPIFGGCKVGIIQHSAIKKLEWCTDPCPKHRAERMA
uniref:Apple domain-containing protein n=1 Tax=Panagrolaimus sp. JU765 TaxID=591449 RepID=A0AC34PWG7_9BILA